MRISREHDPDEPAEKRSKTVTNLAGITGVQRNVCVWSCLYIFLLLRDITLFHARCWRLPKSEARETDKAYKPIGAALTT